MTKISQLTLTGFHLNHALDTGKYADVSVDEVVRHIQAKTVFTFIEKRFGQDVRLTHLHDDERAALLEEWWNLNNAIDAERKFLVHRNGLCLLLAYVLEGIQMRAMKQEK